MSKLHDFMRLHDLVYLVLCKWQESKKGRRYNGFEPKDDLSLAFTGRKASYKVSSALVYPILASLRILMSDKGDWRIDPDKFITASGEALLNVLVSFYDEQCKSKPHELGRSVGSWRAVAAEARARFAEQLLAAPDGSR